MEPPEQDLEALENHLGISFSDRSLLGLAFIHSSYLNENPGLLPESNERLEYLGDALLGLAVAEDLYRQYPERREGELTMLRSAIVRGDTLARVADGLDLGRHLVMGIGEQSSGGAERRTNLAAVLEALVGALFLDQGYAAARDFSLRVLAVEMSDADYLASSKNAKSELQELVQGQGKSPPTYSIISMAGKDHDRTFTAQALVEGEVVGRGVGSRKANAEQAAARQALQKLHGG
ncbi:MAG: ribonuclease III [Chloroflexi bacterium]|nr:ribonuclease III [Chloroflexota bacterium]